MSNRERESLKRQKIGKSAAKLPGDRKKVQRLVLVILFLIYGNTLPFHNYIMKDCKNIKQGESTYERGTKI
jgi:hypothetical protein